MMQQQVSMILFLLFVFASAEWGTQKAVFTTTDELTAQHMWLDPTSATEHFIFSKKMNGVLKTAHLVHYADDTTATTSFLPLHHHHSAHLTGSADGKVIVATFCASRTDSNYIKDIFFVESEDSGKSWSAPIRVARDDMEDSQDRFAPKILYVKETKRVFIFYAKTSGVYFVSRAAGSTIFSKEALIDSTYAMLTDLSATYTFSNSAVVMVHWFTVLPRDSTKGIHIGAYSLDNGIHWKVVKSGNYEYHQNTVITSSNSFDSRRGVMVYNCINDIFEVFFDTRSEKFYEAGSPYKADKTYMTDITFCKDRSGNELLYYYGTKYQSDRSAHENYYRWNFKGQYDKLMNPFSAHMIHSASIGCDQNNHKVIAASILVEGQQYSISVNKWSL